MINKRFNNNHQFVDLINQVIVMKPKMIYWLFILMPFSMLAQKDDYKKALRLFETGNYELALNYFNAYEYAEQDEDILLKRIITNYELNRFDDAKKDVSILLALKRYPEETNLYIAKIFHAEGNYEKAMEYYKSYLRDLSVKSEDRDEVVHLIKQCGMASRIQHIESQAFVDNYGAEINSVKNEFGMIQSPNNKDKYYFNSNRPGATGGKRNEKGDKDGLYGNYNTDIFRIEMNGGIWGNVESISELINTSRDEMILDLNEKGSAMVYLKGPNIRSGVVLADTFALDRSEFRERRFDGPLKGEAGDIYCHFFNDSTLLLASNRPGGYGGYDLYVSARRHGYWLPPKNLGPNVNTRFDEITPFVTKDGTKLFFSSNRVESLGGFDVFESTYQLDKQSWSLAKNMGLPINSPLDDTYFYVKKDGFAANFTSNRKIGGYGGHDLYVAYFKQPMQEQVSLSSEFPFLYFLEEEMKASDKKRRDEQITASETTTENVNPTNGTIPLEETKQEFSIDPFYYEPQGLLVTSKNQKEINLLVQLMTTYPSLKLEINAYTVQEGTVAYDLYFTIKKADDLVDYLSKKGIRPNRINIKAYGSAYPFAKNPDKSNPNAIADKVNRRFEFRFMNAENLPIVLNYTHPEISKQIQNPDALAHQYNQNGLSYRVEIARSSQMFQHEALATFRDPVVEKIDGKKQYLYCLGLYYRYQDAVELTTKLKNYQISTTFVVPYINGVRVPNNELIDYAKAYPDLINYMQDNE